MFIWEGDIMSENRVSFTVEFSDKTFEKFLLMLKEVADRDVELEVHVHAPRKRSKFNFPKSRD